jgi:PEP-CTERM motif
MKRKVLRALAASSFALSLMSYANAVPISLEFSGLLSTGERATGQFQFETAGMERFAFPDSVFYSDLLGTGARPSPVLGQYTLGGQTITLNTLPENGYGSVVYNDFCTPVCIPHNSENWSIQLYDQSFPFLQDPPESVYTYRSMGFISASPFDFSTGLSQDYFDMNAVTAETVLTIPFREMSGFYQETLVDCTLGECQQTIKRSDQFIVDTVTRGTTPVPEPGTLGLLGAGVLGLLAMRRRRRGVEHECGAG